MTHKTPEDESEHMPPDDEGADEGLEEEEVPPPTGAPEPSKEAMETAGGFFAWLAEPLRKPPE